MDDFQKMLIRNTIHSIAASILMIALPLYLETMGISYTSIGLIFGLSPILSLLINYTFGTHSDTIGRKPLLIISSALWAIYFTTITLATKSIHFMALGLIKDSASPLGLIGTNTYLSDIIPKGRRATKTGILSGTLSIASGITMLASGYMILRFGYIRLFLACATTSFATLMISISLTEHITPKKSGIKEMIKDLHPKGISSEIKNLFLIKSTADTTFQLITAFGIPLYFKSLGAPTSIVGLIMGIMWIMHGLAHFISARISDKKNPKNIFTILYLIAIPVNLALIFQQSYQSAAILIIINSTIFGLSTPSEYRIIFDAAGKRNGRDIAFINNSSYIGIIAGSIIAGLIIDTYGFGGIFALRCIGLFTAAAMMYLSMKRFK